MKRKESTKKQLFFNIKSFFNNASFEPRQQPAYNEFGLQPAVK